MKIFQSSSKKNPDTRKGEEFELIEVPKRMPQNRQNIWKMQKSRWEVYKLTGRSPVGIHVAHQQQELRGPHRVVGGTQHQGMCVHVVDNLGQAPLQGREHPEALCKDGQSSPIPEELSP